MSSTLNPAATPAPPAVLPETPKPASAVRRKNPVMMVLKGIASLRLTVVLFVLAMVLVFVGTLAQKDAGIWTVVGKYFRSFWVWVPFQIFFPTDPDPTKRIPGGFPFVGGWTLGALLLVNVVAAHIVRFRYSWKRLGIVLTHTGIILLLCGELITGLYAIESNLTVHENENINYVEERDKAELAIVFPSSKDPSAADRHIVFPENVLKKGGRLTHPEMPFDLEIVKYMTNSDVLKDDGSRPNPATTGEGKDWIAVEKKENAGADAGAGRDIASTYVRLLKKGTDQVVDTYLLSIMLSILPEHSEEKVVVDGQAYNISLRFKRVYKQYTVYLKKFNADYYPGTSIPKNYSSDVRLTDKSRGVDTEVTIKMNSPLRYQGETFFQADWTRDGRKGTVLQVVRNPGWLLPYISCALVGIGLLLHFGMYLVTFIKQMPATPAADIQGGLSK